MKENGVVKNFKQSRNTENFEQCVEEFRPLLELYDECEQIFSNPGEYPMAAFWNSYLNMIKRLRDFIKSIKNEDWDLQMHASEKCYIGFMLMTTITTQDTFHTTGLHNKRYLNIIQQYMKNLKKLVFLLDVLLANSTKCPLIKLLSRP